MDKSYFNAATGRDIIRRLRRLVTLPERGLIAGASVVASIARDLHGLDFPINDVDIFLARDPREVKTRMPWRCSDVEVFRGSYGSLMELRLWQSFNSFHKLVASRKSDDGFRNEIDYVFWKNSDEVASGPEADLANYRSLIDAFDINACQAGVDLASGTIIITPECEEFLKTLRLTMVNPCTPWHTAQRLVKKQGELAGCSLDLERELDRIEFVATGQKQLLEEFCSDTGQRGYGDFPGRMARIEHGRLAHGFGANIKAAIERCPAILARYDLVANSRKNYERDPETNRWELTEVPQRGVWTLKPKQPRKIEAYERLISKDAPLVAILAAYDGCQNLEAGELDALAAGADTLQRSAGSHGTTELLTVLGKGGHELLKNSRGGFLGTMIRQNEELLNELLKGECSPQKLGQVADIVAQSRKRNGSRVEQVAINLQGGYDLRCLNEKLEGLCKRYPEARFVPSDEEATRGDWRMRLLRPSELARTNLGRFCERLSGRVLGPVYVAELFHPEQQRRNWLLFSRNKRENLVLIELYETCRERSGLSTNTRSWPLAPTDVKFALLEQLAAALPAGIIGRPDLVRSINEWVVSCLLNQLPEVPGYTEDAEEDHDEEVPLF